MSPLISELSETETIIFARTLQRNFGVDAVVKVLEAEDEETETTTTTEIDSDRRFIDTQLIEQFGRMMGYSNRLLNSMWAGLNRISRHDFFPPARFDLIEAQDKEMRALIDEGIPIWDMEDANGRFVYKKASYISLPTGVKMEMFRFDKPHTHINMEAVGCIIGYDIPTPGAGTDSRALLRQFLDHWSLQS